MGRELDRAAQLWAHACHERKNGETRVLDSQRNCGSSWWDETASHKRWQERQLYCGAQGQWCWYKYIENGAGVSFGVNSEKCGVVGEVGWDGEPSGFRFKKNEYSLITLWERLLWGASRWTRSSLHRFDAEELITKWNMSPGNLDPMGWAYSSNFLCLQLLKISSTSNRAKIKRDKRGDPEVVKKTLVTIGSWRKLWRKKASNSWMKQKCSSNSHLKHSLFMTFATLALKTWDSNLSHTWEAEYTWRFNLLFSPLLLSPFPKWKTRWKERNYQY